MPRKMPEPPETLEGWKIKECLGSGACGKVHRTERDGEVGAIKFLYQKKITAPTTEVNHASLLAQETMFYERTKGVPIPYIPRMLQKFTKGPRGFYFQVTELFSRGTLADYVRKAPEPFPPSFAYAIGWRLVRCMKAVHQAGWLHLDIKPSNIMIADDPKQGIALIDFGLALPLSFTYFVSRTSVAGTYPFVGVHVWNLERESARDDLEAIGLVMAWIMLKGKLPWSSNDTSDMKRQIVSKNLPKRLSRACGHKVIGEYLTRVRNLEVGYNPKFDEDPKYDELLELLAANSEGYLDDITWSASESTARRRSKRIRMLA